MKFCIKALSVTDHNRSLETITGAAVDFLDKKGPKEGEAVEIVTLLFSEFVKQRRRGALKPVNIFLQFSAGGVCHPRVSTALASSPLLSP